MIERSHWQRAAPVLLGFVVFAAIAAAFVSFWIADRHHAELLSADATRITAEQSARRIEEFVGTRMKLGEVMRTMWESGHVADREAFETKAAAIHDNFEEIVAINWIDSQGVIRWVTPRASNLDALDKDLTLHPVAAPLLQQSLLTADLVSSPPLDLFQGGRGFTTYLPIDTPEGHAGWINVVFRLAPIFENALLSDIDDRFVVVVRDEDKEIFPSSRERSNLSVASYSRPVAVGSRTWELTLTPRAGASDPGHGARADLVLIVGLLVALVAGILTTLRLRSLSDLAAGESRYRGVVEELPDLICRFKPDTTITFVNEGYAAYFGRDRAALIGTSFLDLIPESDHEAVREHLASIDSEQPVRTVEHEVFGANGDVRWQRWRDRALFGPGGEITEFQSIGVDITAEKRAEQALRRSELRYRTLLESVSEGIAVHGNDGRIVEVNDYLCKLIGREPAELIGRDVAGLSGDAPGPSDSIAEAVLEVHRTGESKLLEWRAERPGFGTWWAEIRLTRVETEGDVHVVSAVRDISERKRLEEQLRQSQKLQAVGTLSAGVAHDFNNVITAVLGFSETASLFVEDREEARLAMQGIRRACEQAAGVTRSLLTFSRGGGGEKAPLLVEQVIRDTAGMLQHMMPAAVKLRATPAAQDPVWVEAEESQLQQVLMNLAINARDSLQGGGTIEISCRRIPADRSVPLDRGLGLSVISVTDDGTGMPEEIRARAVEPFFTTKPREQGTGLGLAVVHGIVADHGGELEIESIEGRGTRVSITLPCCESPLAPKRSVAEAPPEPGHGETVIVIEDNDQVRSLITRALGRAGYTVLGATDGIDGVALHGRHARACRAAIVDVDLPGLDGSSCVTAMRSVDPGLPILMISGLPDAARAVDRPDDVAFMQKPFRIDELCRVVGELVARPRPVPD